MRYICTENNERFSTLHISLRTRFKANATRGLNFILAHDITLYGISLHICESKSVRHVRMPDKYLYCEITSKSQILITNTKISILRILGNIKKYPEVNGNFSQTLNSFDSSFGHTHVHTYFLIIKSTGNN